MKVERPVARALRSPASPLLSASDAATPNLVQPIVAGLLAAVVGFGSSFAVVVAGMRAVGASPVQVTSGLVVLCLVMGLAGVVLSLAFRMPISSAWTTPGAALLATGAHAIPFSDAVGAFLVVGAMIVAAALLRPFGRLVEAIPKPLAGAMLAGILLPLVLAPFKALGQLPLQTLAILAVWVGVGRFTKLYAVPAAVAATILVIAFDAGTPGVGVVDSLWPTIVVVPPTFTAEAFVGIALPLFIVTMASQNIPGLAVLAANGYRPPAGPLFAITGLASIVAAPFGALTINLAAITAAMCAGPDAGPDPARRWVAAFTAGAAYLLIGTFAGVAVAIVLVSPPVLVQAVAGLALLGAFGNAILIGLEDVEDRTAVLVTFLLAASGTAFAGVGSAFWGLVAGLAILALNGRLGGARDKASEPR